MKNYQNKSGFTIMPTPNGASPGIASYSQDSTPKLPNKALPLHLQNADLPPSVSKPNFTDIIAEGGVLETPKAAPLVESGSVTSLNLEQLKGLPGHKILAYINSD